MKKAMIAMMLLAAGSVFAAPRISVGIGFGAPAPVAVVRPACPGPGYTWVDGYYANGVAVAGYWAAPAPVVRYERGVDRDDFHHDDRDARRVIAPEHHVDRDAHGDRR